MRLSLKSLLPRGAHNILLYFNYLYYIFSMNSTRIKHQCFEVPRDFGLAVHSEFHYNIIIILPIETVRNQIFKMFFFL